MSAYCLSSIIFSNVISIINFLKQSYCCVNLKLKIKCWYMIKQLPQIFLISLSICSSAAANNAYNWTGAYFGPNFGGIWSKSKMNANDVNFINESYGLYSQNLNNTSIVVGLQMGYLKQSEQMWVVGTEGDFSYQNSHAHFLAVNSIDSVFDKFNRNNELQGSLRLRSGYSIDRLFPFVTAGVGLSHIVINYSNETGNNYSKNTTKAGVIIGGGLEYSFLSKMSLRLEGLYTDYGANLNMSIPSIDDVNVTGNVSIKLNTILARLALNYHF
jgi:opacity protein-like surface antigen